MEKHIRPCVAELLGTFMLCFIGAGAICAQGESGHSLTIAVANGLALSVAASATMYLSGAHLNPAITIMFWVYRKIDNDKAFFYVVAQLLGAMIAGMFLTLLFGSSAMETKLGTPYIPADAIRANAQGWWGRYQVPATAIGIEAVLTFLLAFAVLCTIVDTRSPKIGGFGIGMTAAAAILVGGPLTGAALNPARALGPAVWYHGSFGWDNFLASQVIYIIGPILGAIAAGLIYFNFIAPEVKPAE
jgi:aquaporin Z